MSIYDTLNDKQREAVFHTEGPLLILAGAGSGKTRVLTHRVAYLIEEKGVNPWNIMAITFTNKAAAEMRERVDALVSYGSESIWVSTFHSACVRILRRHIDIIGYDTNFTIYDTDDQKTVIKGVLKKLNLDPKQYKAKSVLAEISHAKEKCISPERYRAANVGDFNKLNIAKIYTEYESQLKANQALDFDDLLLKTVQLFKKSEEVLAMYQERLQYIMVDEYQDTNGVQFEFIKLISGKYKNLCVVGDDDQSIYKFRGADIRNILDFEQVFPNAKVIKLEQNYRSTSNILDTANAVIAHNFGRKDKTLWTDNGDGEKVQIRQVDSNYEEAELIANDIKQHVREDGFQYIDHAILYRTNAQSRTFEESFIKANIPYKIVGGTNFYARREIKDLLSYLKTVNNGADDLAVKRIINVPKRGIGTTSIERISDYAEQREVGFYEALLELDNIGGVNKGAKTKILQFVDLMKNFNEKATQISLSDLLQYVINEIGYIEELKKEGEIESQARIENVDELFNKVAAYEEDCELTGEAPTLVGFLENVALVAEAEVDGESSDFVTLMTLHSAKGLEFPRVYLVGMEDGLFPSYMCITSGDMDELEEERRLCYVGITRAKQELMITCAQRRMVHGETQYNRPSRFIKEMPTHLIESNMSKKTKADPFESAETGYQHAKQIFKAKAYETAKPIAVPVAPVKDFGEVSGGNGLGYDVGDRVRSMRFGEGTVNSLVKGGRDFEVTVAFDNYGVKKVFAAFAKLKKVD